MIQIYVDGGTRYGGICLVDDYKFYTICQKRSGIQTNNDLEYLAISFGVDYANRKYHDKRVTIYSDSMLAVKQINHKWRTTQERMVDYKNGIIKKINKNTKIVWCPRDSNLAGVHLEKFY